MSEPPDPPSSEINGLDPAELLARGLQTVRPTGDGRWVPPDAEEVARLLPQYQIECLLGRGGMGAVYKGRQLALARPVAIKLLPVEMGADSQFVARFEREARTLARLHHSSIVAVYDFGQTEEGHLYFIMEYVDGTDLRQVLRGPGLQIEQALVLISQICDALNAAHRQGVMHRDIKPENVLLTSEGDVKLADFGLARPVHEEEDAGLTATNVVMGTPAYMAPEQHEGRSDHRTDIYALGVMFYEMLTGRPPRGGVVVPPSYRYQVDVRIDEVVMRAMQGEPELRYQTAVEMKSAVDRILTTSPLVGQETAPAPKTQENHQTGSDPRPKQTGWGAGMAVAIVLCLLAVATGAWLWLRKMPEEKSSQPAMIVTPTAVPKAPETHPIAPASPKPIPPPAAVASLSATPSPTQKLTSLTPPTPTAASATPAPRFGEAVDLFDAAHLPGWVQKGPGGFMFERGVGTSWTPADTQPYGLRWYTRQVFGDFNLRLEFKTLEPDSKSGVLLRCTNPTADLDDPGKGYEVQLQGISSSDQPTGSIYFVRKPTSVPLKGSDWNELEITAVGQKYTVRLNGILVNELVGDRATRGYIGLQNSRKGSVQIRNLRIAEPSPSPAVLAPKILPAASPLPSPPQPPRVVQTINPLDPEHLKGWTQMGPGGFKMLNGIATTWVPAGPGSSGICWYTRRPFADLEVTTQFKTLEPTSNSGIMLRCAHPNASFAATGDGYEVQIYGMARADQPTGSIYGFHPPTSVPQKPGEWNELTVRVIGQKYTVHLNGWLVNEFVGDRSLAGYVGLQNHGAGPVQFRNLRISELVVEANQVSALQAPPTVSLSNAPVKSPPPASIPSKLVGTSWINSDGSHLDFLPGEKFLERYRKRDFPGAWKALSSTDVDATVFSTGQVFRYMLDEDNHILYRSGTSVIWKPAP